MKKKPDICVALDGMPWQAATKLAYSLQGIVWGFKFNDLLFAAGGDAVIPHFSRYGRVFADVKAHDIPNTVANTVRRLVEHGASVVTVHASGGKAMLQAAVEAARGSNCLVAAVTVLTSLDDTDCLTVFKEPRKTAFRELALAAAEASVNAVVCSADDLPLVPPDLVTIVPGIRVGANVANDDQKAVARAVPSCNVIVVGRPITQAADPVAAAKAIALAVEEASR